MSGHSPGPWKATRIELGAIDVVGPGRETIAVVEGADLDTPTNQVENARLIAAAPELLEALRAMRHLLWRQGAQFACGDCDEAGCADCLARRAIAKAEGRRE